MRFSSNTLMGLQEFVIDLHTAPDLEALRRVIPEGAARLISSDRANFNEFNLASNRRFLVPSPVPAYWTRLGPVFLAHMEEHPLGGPFPVSTAPRTGAFQDRRRDPRWRRSVLYNEYFVPAGVRQQLFTALLQCGSVRYSLAFNRERAAFSEHERALLEIIAPHVACALRNTFAREALRREIPVARSRPRVGRIAAALTSREREVLHWVREGKRNREIAVILEMSPRTVGKHLERIHTKFGVETRTAAALMAAEWDHPASRAE